MTTTFRADLVAGMTTMMQAFIAANPTVIRRHFRVRPMSQTTDLPCSYLDLRPETVTHDSGLRIRTMNPSVVVVFGLTENAETIDAMDAAVDLLMDHLTSYPHIIAGSWWSSLTVSEEAAEDGNIAVRFTFDALSFGEGRN